MPRVQGADGGTAEQTGPRLFTAAATIPNATLPCGIGLPDSGAPECGGLLVVKGGRRGEAIVCSNKECDYKTKG